VTHSSFSTSGRARRTSRALPRALLGKAARGCLGALEPFVARVVRKTEPPRTADAETDFQMLQSRHRPPAEYGYDGPSLWRRGLARAESLLTVSGYADTVRALEVGCGDATTGALLSAYGHEVVLNDMEDWRAPGARQMGFCLGRVEDGLPLPSSSFDLVYSYNTFEHILEPRAALGEMVRLTRPGGTILLDFGPLYSSPRGLHAYRMLFMPYPQFLFSEQFLRAKLRETGVSDLGRHMSALQPLNHWRVQQYTALFQSGGCHVRSLRLHHTRSALPIVLRYPASFQGRGLCVEDLTVSFITAVLGRPAEPSPPQKGMP